MIIILFFKNRSYIYLGRKLHTIMAVSYTHLDVYKRQALPFFKFLRYLDQKTSTKLVILTSIYIPVYTHPYSHAHTTETVHF